MQELFKPHWSLDKVAAYVRETAACPYAFSAATGMPMLGIYTTGEMASHRRDGKRLREEIGLVAGNGGRSIMICELGDILHDPEVREAITAGLKEFDAACREKPQSSIRPWVPDSGLPRGFDLVEE